MHLLWRGYVRHALEGRNVGTPAGVTYGRFGGLMGLQQNEQTGEPTWHI
ncbi:hypothetical protein TM5383_02117 [Thalassovita mediterranea]|jgi:hypothetical protein|uniref:Uncharacterized protein n=1 Tax=Thalassovita mediterranea TaxID=340021 RepID=A0A0P1GR37_9RHOB|nr:hypothetical protein TM5383_02117 [Thalassovita mediterranea]SIS29090.1 hypothetical protein SAMN05421685_101803 [Thalassovita mediterranea]